VLRGEILVVRDCGGRGCRGGKNVGKREDLPWEVF